MLQSFVRITSVVGLVACSAAEPATSPNRGNTDKTAPGEDHHEVFPTSVHTGFDGETTFKVPVSVVGGAKATWTAADPSMLDIEVQKEGALLTAKKAGTTSVTAKIGDESVKVSVTISAYPRGSHAVGDAIYNKTAKCANCHVSSGGADHSPSEIGKHEDAHVRLRITKGESLHGEPVQENHKFGDTLNADEVTAAVAFIRALAPRGWPKEEHGHE